VNLRQLKPMNSMILVEPIKMDTDREEKTKSGIILTKQTDVREDLSVARAKVIAVADGIKEYKKGDVVVYNFFSGNTVTIPGKDPLGEDDKEQHLVWSNDILAKEIK